jgi:diguanylate cyclase (GGDEF)-like protein
MEIDRNFQASMKKAFDRLGEFISRHFLRLTIAHKLMFGFSSLLVLMVVISLYALTNLNQLNAINKSILLTDLPVISASEKMIDVIFAEELYTRRYLVLRTSDVLDLADKKAEFKLLLNRIESVPEKRNFPVAEIAVLHEKYVDLLNNATKYATPPATSISAVFDQKIKAHQEKFISTIKAMSEAAQWDQNRKTNKTAAIGTAAFKAAKVLCGIGLILSLAAATIITRNISGAITKIKFATEKIAKGEFDHKLDIHNSDELGDLANAFITMADRLKHLEEMNLDTSPLTRLPGGTTIENIMNKRIDAKAQIAFCMMDIDNFKAYNDCYGYAKGNEIIQATANIISKAVANHGGKDDFVGHIGGDDFVCITTPDRFRKICKAIVKTYDKAIPNFYDPEDRKRGNITAEDRQGNRTTFPLASLSIAVVTNEDRVSLNHIQFGEVAAEVKKEAKATAGSVFLVDKRRANRGTKKDRRVVNIRRHRS